MSDTNRTVWEGLTESERMNLILTGNYELPYITALQDALQQQGLNAVVVPMESEFTRETIDKLVIGVMFSDIPESYYPITATDRISRTIMTKVIMWQPGNPLTVKLYCTYDELWQTDELVNQCIATISQHFPKFDTPVKYSD